MNELTNFRSQILGKFLGQEVERYISELNPDGYRSELHHLRVDAFFQHINKDCIFSEPPRSALCYMVKISLFSKFKDKPPVGELIDVDVAVDLPNLAHGVDEAIAGDGEDGEEHTHDQEPSTGCSSRFRHVDNDGPLFFFSAHLLDEFFHAVVLAAGAGDSLARRAASTRSHISLPNVDEGASEQAFLLRCFAKSSGYGGWDSRVNHGGKEPG